MPTFTRWLRQPMQLAYGTILLPAKNELGVACSETCGSKVILWVAASSSGGITWYTLVYPIFVRLNHNWPWRVGDPLRYHSHFIASVLESPTSSLRPMEIVAHGRLGTATKKAHLLCRWDDEKKNVSYLSIEWAGFGWWIINRTLYECMHNDIKIRATNRLSPSFSRC